MKHSRAQLSLLLCLLLLAGCARQQRRGDESQVVSSTRQLRYAEDDAPRSTAPRRVIHVHRDEGSSSRSPETRTHTDHDATTQSPETAPFQLPWTPEEDGRDFGHVAGQAVLGDDGDGFRRIDRELLPVSPAMPGIVLPYPIDRVFSTFSDCRPGGRTHMGLDLGGIGQDAGLGTPLYAMARARITFIGRPEDDPAQFGEPETHAETVVRGRTEQRLPARSIKPGYGQIHFFTRTYGSWRSGTIIVMQALDGPLAGHRIRYMHLGAIHPELRVGDIVEAGQEVALMGGTAVQRDLPHVHIDIETPQGRRVDVAPYLGLPADPGRCRPGR